MLWTTNIKFSARQCPTVAVLLSISGREEAEYDGRYGRIEENL